MVKHPIEQSFDRWCRERPESSSYINFVRAVKGRGISMSLVLIQFKKLVERDDWGGVPWDEIVENLQGASGRQKTLILSHQKIRILPRRRELV